MSTTTLRLPDEVKERIDRLAAAQGKSAHALMVDTLDESTAAMERRIGFDRDRGRGRRVEAVLAHAFGGHDHRVELGDLGEGGGEGEGGGKGQGEGGGRQRLVHVLSVVLAQASERARREAT